MIRGEKCSLEINTFEEDVSGSFTKKKHKLQLGGKKTIWWPSIDIWQKVESDNL